MSDLGDQTAVIGMALRFPGADSPAALWQLLCDGREGLTRFDKDELRAAGVPDWLINKEGYVPVNGRLDDVDYFDADFFAMPPREARITDPQHRIMLELAWQALEDAGLDAARYDGAIGVFAGCGSSSYLLNNLWPNRETLATVGELPVQLGNNKDYLATRISYKLDLTGPSVCVTTACSTSLVAVHLAAQSLIDYQCDVALAGGAGIQLPQETGYLFQTGGILSPDGHCRAFDAQASGTVSGNGGALVVLKRAQDAFDDGDNILALIRGSAINNDGADKAGFTAPSVNGQAEVIREAHDLAGVDPATIGYVETHGTGTPLGDPIEVAALRQAFGEVPGTCWLGSIKTNLGHMDEAAGVAGLIKAVLCLRHQAIPASLHYQAPNPEIDFGDGMFAVNNTLRSWDAGADDSPRRAAVSSFGIGGTNAHVVLEEAPPANVAPVVRDAQLLPLSGRTSKALSARAATLADALRDVDSTSLADAAFTLQSGRRALAHRGFVVADNAIQARDSLLALSTRDGVPNGGESPPPVIFLCSGQGSQYPQMARRLYDTEAVFKNALDACAQHLSAQHGIDLLSVLFAQRSDTDDARAELHNTALAQPALFSHQVAISALWDHWGVKPDAVIGHSVGEYVAAYLAGVMSLQTALDVVAARGRLMQSAPTGAMLAVPRPAAELAGDLVSPLELAAINAPDRCVVSGTAEAIEELMQKLLGEGCQAQRLVVSHAFHCALMDPILEDFRSVLSRHQLQAPKLPMGSNVSGAWMGTDEACDSETYVRQLRSTVNFEGCLRAAANDFPYAVWVEIGPGQALASAARRTLGPRTAVYSSLPTATQPTSAHHTMLSATGELWARGVDIDWSQVAEPERQRVQLPGYPFERQRHWFEATSAAPDLSEARRNDVSQWFYVPSWRRLPALGWSDEDRQQTGTWLVLGADSSLGASFLSRLLGANERVIKVVSGERFAVSGGDEFVLRPDHVDDYRQLFVRLNEAGVRPTQLVNLFTHSQPASGQDYQSFHTLMALARALSSPTATTGAPVLTVVTSQVEAVSGEEDLWPSARSTLGAATVIGQELPSVVCRSIDLALAGHNSDAAVDSLLSELRAPPNEPRVALRGRFRWAFDVEPVALAPATGLPRRLRQHGTYVITGGLGKIGLLLATYLVRRVSASVVLIGRTGKTSADNQARLDALQAEGAVMVLQADVTLAAEMTAARARIEAQFGAIDGVIHAAALPAKDSMCAIADTSRQSAEREFAVKGNALTNLHQVFADSAPNFFMLFSSLSSVLGGLGFAAYAGANHVLDASAERHALSGGSAWTSVNWDAWNLESPDPSDIGGIAGRLNRDAITAEEAPGAFDILFDDASGSAQLMVSTSDLRARLKQWRGRLATQGGSASGVSAATAGSAAHDSGAVAAGGGTQQQMMAIWRDVLGVYDIAAADDFFLLNGDSLLGTQLIGRINQHFQISLGMRDLFENSTLEGLLRLVDAAAPSVEQRVTPSPQAADYPLSNAQRRVWIVCQSPSAMPAYNMSYSLRLRGELASEALHAAFQYVVDRHESLRTQFVQKAGQPRQVVVDAVELSLPIADLSQNDDPLASAHEAVLHESLQPFASLEQAPLLRTGVLRLGDDDHVVYLTLHHIIADGLTLNVLMDELHAAYSVAKTGQKPLLESLPLQYRDFAVWQDAQANGRHWSAHRDYWLGQLQGDNTSLELPTDRPRGTQQGRAGGQVFVTLEEDFTQRLRTLAREQHATVFMVLSAALNVVLHHATGQASITVGTPVAGRDQAELHGLVGLFLNNVVLRESVSRRETFLELLARNRATVTHAFEHQAYPFDQIVSDLGLEPTPGRTPLFDVLLNLMPSQALQLRLGDLQVSGFSGANETALFDLNIMVTDSGSQFAMEFAYNTDLFDRSRIESWANAYICVLREVATNAEVSVRDLCAQLGETPAPSQANKADFLANALNLDEEF